MSRTPFTSSSLLSTICFGAVVGIAMLTSLLNDVRAADAPLDPEQPYQARRSRPVTYDVDFSIVVTPPYKAKKLAVWLPLPGDDLGQEIRDSRLSSFPIAVEPQVAAEEKFGNRFAYFEFASPQGAQVIRHKFRVTTWELRWDVDPAQVVDVAKWPASFDKYRRGDSQAVIVDERFEKLLVEVAPRRDAGVGRNLNDVMNWVQAKFEYDHHDASLKASAVHALEKRRGHCSDYHGFCASMGRALGVPTRVTYGINTFPKNSPSHCKLEAYLAPYGWVSFDVSETQRLCAAIRASADLDDPQRKELIERAQLRLARGFRDNTWFLQTRGTDYDLAPKASRRAPVVRTAWIEADGVPLPEPDPADKSQTAFSWMTVHEYRADQNVAYPFADWKSLTATDGK